MSGLLGLRHISAGYGDGVVLHDVSLDVEAGDALCLLGRNGVGKTTLMKTVMGLIKPKTGHILFDGQQITALASHQRARLGIGYVPQGREIFPQLTVEENLRVGLAARKDGSRAIPPRVFDLFPVLKQMLRRRGGDLSGGQQQQLGLVHQQHANLEPLLLAVGQNAGPGPRFGR